MKAAVCDRYGAVEHIRVADVPKPQPRSDEILVRVHATPVTTGDWRIQSLNIPRGFQYLMRMIYGFSKPRQPILGTQLSGVVEAIGTQVQRFKVGDAIIAECALSLGAHAEYTCLAEKGSITTKPQNLSFEEAAAVGFGAVTAFGFLKRKAMLKSGERLLVYGASGSVGSAAVQIGKALGAQVTGVCSRHNADFVRALGADAVVDYTKQDFTMSGQQYDIILDAFGGLTMTRCQGSLARNGRLLLVSADLPQQLAVPFQNFGSSKKIISGVVNATPDLMKAVCDLVSEGHLQVVIDRLYDLDQVAEAYAYVGQRHKRGNVVIQMTKSLHQS